MKRTISSMRIAAAVLVLVMASLPAAARQTRTPPPQASPQKVAAALEQSGLNYRKAADAIWAVTFTGSRNTSIDVIVNGQNPLIVVLAVVAKKPALSAAQLTALLRVSYDANYSKVAIDNDGDLLALTELASDSLTAPVLRTAIEEVANTADSAAAALGGSTARSTPESPEVVPAGKGASLSLVRGAFEISYDPKKWTREATPEANVIQLNHVSGDAFMRIISERIQIENDNLRDVALTNAKTTAPDVQLDSETWRTVNGLRTLVLKYSGRASGIRFTFLNQMYSDPSGTVQLAGWTGSNLFEEYRRDFLELFSGFRKVQ